VILLNVKSKDATPRPDPATVSLTLSPASRSERNLTLRQLFNCAIGPKGDMPLESGHPD
jgi:hypothetical protein